jgi:hypothetical protein
VNRAAFRPGWPGLATLAPLVVACLAFSGVPSAHAAALAADSSSRFERVLSVGQSAEVDVQTESGHISVRTWNGPGVRVVGEVRLKAGLLQTSSTAQAKIRHILSHPPIHQRGNSIRIGGLADAELLRDLFISYEIQVPEETRLRSNTGLGDLSVDGLRGPVSADTGAGRVTISRVFGDVHANSGLGDIQIREVRGSLRVDSSAGNVSAEGEPAGIWRLSTGLGDVRVRFLGQRGLDLHAETGLGSISTNYPLLVEGLISQELRGKLRGGGLLVELKSGAGSIHIE